MTAIDWKEKLKELYLPDATDFSSVNVPNLPFAMIDGAGDPTGETYKASLKWLFAAVQPIRRLAREKMGKNFVEPPLETLWWADDMQDLVAGKRDKFKWRLMIHLPHWLEQTQFDAALVEAAKKLKTEAPKDLRFEWFEEGEVMQIMHIGPNEEARPTLDRLYQKYLPHNGLEAVGYYHEIYLNDPKRVAPEKRKTVLRQPVKPADG